MQRRLPNIGGTACLWSGVQCGRRGRRPIRPAVLALHPGDVSLTTALGAVIAMGAPLLALTLAGHPRDAVFAAFGSFTGLYGADLPCRPRATRLGSVGIGFVAAVILGGTAGPLAGTWVWAVAIALVAAVAKYLCDAARIGTPGPWMFVFAFAASIPAAGAAGDLSRHALLAAGGAAVAWCVAMLSALRDPLGPVRRATAAALDRTAEVLAAGDAADPRTRHLAHTALHRAVSYLRQAPQRACVPLWLALEHAEDLLAHAVLFPGADVDPAEALALRRSATQLRRSRGRPAWGSPVAVTLGTAGSDVGPVVLHPFPGTGRSARDETATRLLSSARVFVAAGAAATISLALGMGHPYWAPVSATAVLQSSHARMAWHRGLQRGTGTAVGLLVAALLLQWHPGPLVLAVLVVVMQLAAQLFTGRNYALGVVFITPLTMLLSELLQRSPARALVWDRFGGVALGILVALAGALLVPHPATTPLLRRAIERCDAALIAALAEDADVRITSHELRDALVELRDAEDVARGEAWPTRIPRSLVADLELRAYQALAHNRSRLQDPPR
jgi:hypothetical protein